jgi:hypothetical protein
VKFDTETDFFIRAGWGMRATTTERAMAHVQMTSVMADDGKPEWNSDRMTEQAVLFTSSIIADLLALAVENGMDVEVVLEKARQELDENLS